MNYSILYRSRIKQSRFLFSRLKVMIFLWLLVGEVKTLPPPKPESTLREGYGLLYKYLGKLFHGVNKFLIVLGYELPQMYYRSEIDLLPEDFCEELGEAEGIVTMLQFVCNSIWPMALRNQDRIQVLQLQLDYIAYHDLPAILPGFQVEDIQYQPPAEQLDPETQDFYVTNEDREINETLLALLEEEHVKRYRDNPELDNMLVQVLTGFTGTKVQMREVNVREVNARVGQSGTQNGRPRPRSGQAGKGARNGARSAPKTTVSKTVLLNQEFNLKEITPTYGPGEPKMASPSPSTWPSNQEWIKAKPPRDTPTREKRSVSDLTVSETKETPPEVNQTDELVTFTLTEIDQFLDYLEQKEMEIERSERQMKQVQNETQPEIVLEKTEEVHNREKRFIGVGLQLLGLGMEGAKMGMDIHNKKKMHKTLNHLKKRMNKFEGKIVHIQKEMVSLAQATFSDIDRIMKILKYVHKELNYMFWQINKLKIWMIRQQSQIVDLAAAVALLTEIWTKVLDWQNREITLLLHLIAEMNHLLDALDNLSTGHLSHTVVSPFTLTKMKQHVAETLLMYYSEFELIITETHEYYNIPIGSFVYTEGILAIQVPLFIKPKVQEPFMLYQLRSVPVPYHMNEAMIGIDESKYTYTWLKPSSPMLAMNTENYIGVREEHLKRCLLIGDTYICQEVFLMKQKNFHTCESAIYYRVSYEIIKNKCEIDYYPHLEPEPDLLDQGDKILLTGLKDKWTYYCQAKDQAPNPIDTGHYVVINKTDLCRCSISTGEYHVQQNIAYCPGDTDNVLEFGYTVNMAVIMYLFTEQTETKPTDLVLYNSPYEFDPEEPDIWKEDDPDVFKEELEDQCFALGAVMSNLLEDKSVYASKGDKYVANNEVIEWWQNGADGNPIKRFFLIVGIVTLGLVLLCLILGLIYLGMRGKVRTLDDAMTRILKKISLPMVAISQSGQAQANSCDNIRLLTERTTEAIFRSDQTQCIVKCMYIGHKWLEYVKLVGSLMVTMVVLYLLYKLFRLMVQILLNTNLTTDKFWNLFTYSDRDKIEIHILLTKTFEDGTTKKLSFILGTFEGTFEDLEMEGAFTVGDVTYEPRFIWGYIHILWSSLTLKHKAVPLNLPTIIQVPIQKTWQMNKFTKSLKKNEDLVKVHLYGKSIWDQFWKQITNEPVLLELGELNIPDMKLIVTEHGKKEQHEIPKLYPSLHVLPPTAPTTSTLEDGGQFHTIKL